jgi:hypothetical protein
MSSKVPCNVRKGFDTLSGNLLHEDDYYIVLQHTVRETATSKYKTLLRDLRKITLVFL